jgi:hypothetical protein
MKTIIALLSAALLSAGVLHAKDPKPADTKPAAAGEKPAGDLHALMKSIGGDFGKLMKTIDKPEQLEANKELAKKLAETTEQCAGLVPSKAEKAKSEAEGARITKSYKAEIEKLAENFRKIETALGKKDFAAAKSAAAACTALKKQDHPKFIQQK